MADTPQTFSDNAQSVASAHQIASQSAQRFSAPITSTVDTEVARVKREAQTPSAIDTAMSLWRRETLLGDLLTGYRAERNGDALEMDSSFNPYAYFAQNKDEWRDIEPFVRQGGFDHIYNENQFISLASKVRGEMKDIKNIENGGALGMALGMGLSLLDVATLVPFAKPIQGASTAYNVGRVGASAMAMQGAQEMYLHHSQETRTAAESAVNVGLAGVLGGGIGAWAAARHPEVRAKIDRALDPEADHEVRVAAAGQNPNEAETVGSLGAARYTGEDTKLAGGGTKVGNWLRSATPVGRSVLWTASAAREVMQGMVDLGGTLTKGMSEGRSGGLPAEALAREYMVGYEQSMESLGQNLYELNIALGESGSRTVQAFKQDIGAMTGNKFGGIQFDQELFNRIVSMKLTNETWQSTGAFKGIKGDTDIDAQWIRKTLKEYGFADEVFDTVDQHTSKAAKDIQRVQLELEDMMVAKGMIPEEKRLGNKYGFAQLWNTSGILDKKDEARSFFMSIFSKKPSEEFLNDFHGMSMTDFEKLPLTDPKRGQIMTEWAGEAEDAALRTATENFDAAFKKAAELQRKAQIEADVAGILKADHKKASAKTLVENARHSVAAAYMTRIEKMKGIANEAAAQLEQVEAKLADHTRLAEQVAETRGPLGELLDTLGPKIETARDGSKTTKGRVGLASKNMKAAEKAGNPEEVARLTKLRDDLKAELATYSGAYREALGQFKATAKELRLSAKWLDGAVRSVEESKTKIKLAKGKEALEELEGNLLPRLEKARAAAEAAHAAQKEAHALRMTMQKSATASKRAATKAGSELDKANKTVEKLKGKMPLVDYVDGLVDRLTSKDKIPLSQLKDNIGDSGRVKDRMIHLSTAERRAAEEAGFLHHDLAYVLERQHRDMAGRMALIDKFGEVDMKNAIKRINDEYDSLIRNAKDEKLANKLKDERKNALQDVETMRDHMLGRTLSQDDPDSLLTWTMGKLRQATFLRFVGGFTVSSLTDLASHVLHGALGKDSLAAARHVSKILHAGNISRGDRELKSMVQALEMMMTHSTAGKMAGINDLFNQQGIGTGLTKKITGHVDRFTNFIASRANTYAGMTHWNAIGKGTAGLVQMANLARDLPKYASLSKLRKAELASLGIGDEEAAKLAGFMTKHGEWDKSLFYPNAFNWHAEKGGLEAHRLLRTVTRQLMDRAVLTPGIGDVPLLMNSTLGKAVLQFQSMGFAFTNRFLTPAAQRLFLHGDKRVAWSMVTLFGMANLSEALKTYIRGDDLSNIDAEAWTYAVVQRSGLMAYMGSYLDAGQKMAGLNLGGGTGKFAANSAWESLIGPWAGTLKTGVQVGSAVADGDIEKAAKKAHLLMPFNQFTRVAGHIYDDSVD